MKTIAIIGTGIMGHAMASNFMKQGYPVVVWNRTVERYQDLVNGGARAADSPSEAVILADIVFEVTADDQSSAECWTGPGGILSTAKPGQVLITSATLSTTWTDKLANLCSDKNLQFLDMPLTGGRVAAESGSLTLLVGGDSKVLDNARPDLAAVSTTIKHFGKAGNGMRYKLVLNHLQAIHVAGMAESLRLAREAGLDITQVGDALCERPGGVVTGIAWKGFKATPAPLTFSVEWIHKDLSYAQQMAARVKHPLLDDVLATYQEALNTGQKGEDWTIITKDTDNETT